MKKKTTVKRTVRRPPDVITFIWLQQQFDELHREHNLILGAIKKIGGNVSPALESAVNEVYARAVKIDEKVPDKNVPPGKTRRKDK